MSVAAIVLAGGSGSRLHQQVNKVFLPLGDREMLAYSIETMDRSPMIDRIVAVVRDEDRKLAERLIGELGASKVTDVVIGGSTRHRSEHRGLEALADQIGAGDIEIVVIHDGARPFMTTKLLHTTIDAARRSGGGAPGMPLEAPAYRYAGEEVEALPHQQLRRMQTPQAFRAGPLLDAYLAAAARGTEGVDTAETVGRHTDLRVEVVAGDPRNIKVTFVEDIFHAEDLATSFAGGAWAE
jgi:2-C-methyl-D-erythritol 4-phosphate cytidylyltransferase